MAYTGGLKRPMNMIEHPVWPNIKQGPPRFVDAKKHWKVDAGDAMLDSQTRTDFYTDAVLAQSRDYNKQYAYGIDYHKDVVNKAFRPPITAYEDQFPLSRIPRDFVIPRINPETVGSNGGTCAYSAQNTSFNDLDKYMNDKVKTGIGRPTFFAPVDIPIDNSVLPDLKLKIPHISASAGYEPFVKIDAPLPDVTLHFNRLNTDGDSGIVMPYVLDAPNAMEQMELQPNREFISMNAGYQYDFTPTFTNQEYNMLPSLKFDNMKTKVESVNQLNVINPTPVDYDMAGIQEMNNVNDYMTNRPEIYQSAVPSYNVMDMSATQQSKPFFRTKMVPTGQVTSGAIMPKRLDNNSLQSLTYKPRSKLTGVKPQKKYRI